MTEYTNKAPSGNKEASPTISPAKKAPLWTRSFIALLITQFLVALNDNVFRWLIIPIGKYAVGWSESPDMVRMIGSLAFLLPFLVMTTYAGYCTDRFNRRGVIIGCKIAEVVILIFGTVAILVQNVPFMLFVLFLLGAQSAFFSPAKYSSLPSVVPNERISEANGFYAFATMFACILGQLLGGCLFVATTLVPDSPTLGTGGMHQWWIWSAALLGIAVAGLISSFFIPSLPASNPAAPFPKNPFIQTWRDLAALFRYRFLFWAALGSSFFWGLGVLGQMNIDKYATELLHVRQDFAMVLLVILSLGLAGGALLSGFLARGRVNYGLVPIGAFFIVVFGVVLGFTPGVPAPADGQCASIWSHGFLYGSIGLFLLGTACGLYDLPLLTTLQTRSPSDRRGRILAAYNFFSFSAMALFSLLQGVLTSPRSFFIPVDSLDANGVWFACAVMTVPVFLISLRYLFVPFLREMVSLWLKITYNPRLIDVQNVPEEGGVLLVSNHYSYIDTLLIYCACRRPVRFIAHSDYLPGYFARKLASAIGTIEFVPGDRRGVVRMIRQSREALKNGDVVCIFPEGGITRTGQTNPFAPGFLSILKGNDDVPVVPVFLGGLFGSVFAYSRPRTAGRFRGRLSKRVTVAFGCPLYRPKYAQHVQHKVEELGVEAMSPYRFPKDRHLMIPAREFIRNARRYPRQRRIADSTGVDLDGRGTLLRALVFRRALRGLLDKDEKIVGLLFPTSVGGVLANAAIGLDRRVPVNINFTFHNETINYCVQKTDIRHILTTKKLLQKMPNLNITAAKVLVLEDVLKDLPKSVKILGFLESLLPTWLLERLLGLHKVKVDELNTIVLTSGSTGLPKGAMLTNANISANMQGFYEMFRPTLDDSLLAALPLFHSYGYSTTTWFPLIQEASCIYHFSPLDSKIIGELGKKYKPTIMATTPTFLRNYLRRCDRECFDHFNLTVTGAEKQPVDLLESWHEKYGQQLSEGFGVTELSPVLGTNIPDTRKFDDYFPYYRFGSVGRICSGFVARIVDLDTGVEVPPNEQGMLEVKGHSVMLGYYKDPERTAKAFHDGWYVTGDIARMDEDGFIFITGRQTRMSKIGGEMVPHILIEERLEEVFKAAEKAEKKGAPTPDIVSSADDGPDTFAGVRVAVTAVPDAKKGEKIVVLYTEIPLTPEETCKALLASGLQPIWVPAAVNFHKVDKIPVLGTGKLSLREIKDMAEEIYRRQ